MALNFNLLNPDAPAQIAGSFQRGYEGAQDRNYVLAQRQQEMRNQTAQIIQNGAKSIAMFPKSYKSVFAKVKQTAGVPLDEDEKRYDEAFATGGEDAVKQLAIADANFDIQTLQSFKDRQDYEDYLKSQTSPATPSTPSATPAPGALGSGMFDIGAPAPVDVRQDGSRVTNALAPSVIEKFGLQQPSVPRFTNALAPSVIESVGLSPQSVNAMAPQVPPTAPVNATQRRLAELEAQYSIVSRINDPNAIRHADRLLKQIQKLDETQVVSPGSTVLRNGEVVYQAPAAPPAPTELARNYALAVQQGFKGSVLDYQRAIAAAGRAPAQPRAEPAPTITQIQNPVNPSQMITIDARRYQGGGVGSPGVIGTSGKTAPAEAAAQKQEQGVAQAQDILDNLRFAYEELNRQRAIPSTERSAISNILTSIGTSGVGQVASRVAGTEAQTQRDIIASARNQLFAAVKNATGLSAQNLNSNVEFTTWLNSLTDPAKSIEANRKILENMEKFIASNGKYSTRKGGGQVAPSGVKPAASIAPPPGFTPD